jgi:hypothetical protein
MESTTLPFAFGFCPDFALHFGDHFLGDEEAETGILCGDVRLIFFRLECFLYLKTVHRSLRSVVRNVHQQQALPSEDSVQMQFQA